MLKCALETGENILSKRNTALSEFHTGRYINNCAQGKRVSTVCPGIKEYVFDFCKVCSEAAFHTENIKVSWNINSLHSISYSCFKLKHAHMHKHLTFEHSNHVAWTGTDMYTMALQWGEYPLLFPLL